MTFGKKRKPHQIRLNRLVRKQEDNFQKIIYIEKQNQKIQEQIWKIYEEWNK